MNITELIADLQLHFPASDPKEVAKALLAQQVCIKQKDAALQRCTKFTQEDYDALALQPDLSALREHDAEVVKAFVDALATYEKDPQQFVIEYIERIRKGE